MLELIPSPFTSVFQEFIERLDGGGGDSIICSPYITLPPVQRLVTAVQRRGIAETMSLSVLTDISAATIVQGATNIDALLYLSDNLKTVQVTYLPRIHAKVYVTGESFALVGSANFTDGGASRNFEYGVRIIDPMMVGRIRSDISDYARLGASVAPLQLQELRESVREVRNAVRNEQRTLREKMRPLSEELSRQTEDRLISARVEGRSVNAIFSDTILYLLARNAMTTVELNAAIQAIHPDLCDDSVDRVIEGQRFGKLWKHGVRGAQVTLRRQARIHYDAATRLWSLPDSPSRKK